MTTLRYFTAQHILMYNNTQHFKYETYKYIPVPNYTISFTTIIVIHRSMSLNLVALRFLQCIV